MFAPRLTQVAATSESAAADTGGTVVLQVESLDPPGRNDFFVEIQEGNPAYFPQLPELLSLTQDPSFLPFKHSTSPPLPSTEAAPAPLLQGPSRGQRPVFREEPRGVFFPGRPWQESGVGRNRKQGHLLGESVLCGGSE